MSGPVDLTDSDEAAIGALCVDPARPDATVRGFALRGAQPSALGGRRPDKCTGLGNV